MEELLKVVDVFLSTYGADIKNTATWTGSIAFTTQLTYRQYKKRQRNFKIGKLDKHIYFTESHSHRLYLNTYHGGNDFFTYLIRDYHTGVLDVFDEYCKVITTKKIYKSSRNECVRQLESLFLYYSDVVIEKTNLLKMEDKLRLRFREITLTSGRHLRQQIMSLLHDSKFQNLTKKELITEILNVFVSFIKINQDYVIDTHNRINGVFYGSVYQSLNGITYTNKPNK